MHDAECLDDAEVEQESDDDFSLQSCSLHLINQPELNDLVEIKIAGRTAWFQITTMESFEKSTIILVFRSRPEGLLHYVKV